MGNANTTSKHFRQTIFILRSVKLVPPFICEICAINKTAKEISAFHLQLINLNSGSPTLQIVIEKKKEN